MNSVKKTRDGLFGSGKFYKNALSIAVPIMLAFIPYFVIKLLDLVKVVIFHIWLRKERWLKNLTVPQAA